MCPLVGVSTAVPDIVPSDDMLFGIVPFAGVTIATVGVDESIMKLTVLYATW
jgi:hypothetical protein